MKVAAAQIACLVGDVEANLARIEHFAREAAARGANIVVFPEMADTGYVMAVIGERASPWSEGAVPRLQKIAQQFSIAIACGVSERVNGRIYNAQVVVDHAGNIIGRNRKAHLFTPDPIGEHHCFTPGDSLNAFSLSPFTFGLTICYDLRFPEIYRRLATVHGTNAFLLSSAWPCPRAAHFRALAVARAIENQSYLIASNRVGTDDGVRFCGGSHIIDPGGQILAAASDDGEELIVADISRENLDTVRHQLPVFEHRRTDLYR